MSLATVERALTSERARAAVIAERRAWVVIWVAFATFCALVFAGVKFGIDYVSNARVDQSASVLSSQGQVAFSVPASPEKRLLEGRSDLTVGSTLWLDGNSETSADLQLFDDSTLKLLAGSTLELTRMEVGRFINQHAVVLTQHSGPVRYATGDTIDVEVPGASLQLAGHGDYTVWRLDDEHTRVLVYSGEARASYSVPGSGATTSSLATENHRLEIDARASTVQVADLTMSLLSNPDFARQDQDWQRWDVPNSPLDVNGTRSWVTGPNDSGPALRVQRLSVKNEHGETGLIQKFDGLDVSGFRHLWLQAWVRVDYADLSGGGTLGSEYPMMFRVNYQGPANSFNPWSIGFYYANPDNRPIPPGRAVAWPQGEWRQYSVDLMDTDPNSVPLRLLEFAVMGQGHSYDARVAGISLIGS